MILRHLRYFASVAEHGSIVGAAKALRLAQPSLSRQIRDLELTTCTALLERTRRGVRLTPAGEALLDSATSVATSLDQALRRAQLAHEGKLGTLRVGLGRAALQSGRAGRAITAIRGRLPDVELDVIETGSFAQPDWLVNGGVDLVIGIHDGTEERGVRRERLFDEPVGCAMLAASHPLASASSIQPAQLEAEPLLMIDPAIARGFPTLYDALRRLHKGPIELHQTVDSIYNLAAVGRGWAPALTALKGNAPSGTSVVPLAGLNVPIAMCVAWRARDRSRLIANVVAVLRQECDDAPESTSADRSRSDAGRRGARTTVDRAVRGLEARHLRALVVTVAEGSVSRAAARLGLTQSGLSRRLRALEIEVGIPLFRRGPHGIVPNSAGMVLHDDAVEILAAVDAAIAQARGAQRGFARPCKIGAVPNELTGDLLPGVIRHLSQHHPEMAIEVTELLTTLQASALRSREIDVGLARMHSGVVDDPGIASVQIGDDVVECALLSTSHPLASRTWLTADDLADIPFLFIRRASSPRFYDSIMQALAHIGLTPRIEGWFSGPRTLWRLTADAMGWTIGTRVQRANPPSGLVAIPIEGVRVPSGVQVLWRRDDADARVKAVLDAFRAGAVLG